MSKIEVNQISSQCGSTLTIGQSGDTVTLACGATAAGFGSTGEVSWDTTKKTSGFTAVSGVGYFCDTTSAAFTVTLPASPSAGNVVAVSDYNGTAATNNITVGRNSSNINGAAEDFEISKSNSSIQFIYIDATVGWQTVFTGNTSDTQNPFIVATGGTVTCCGDYKIHTFTGPGTFTVTNAGTGSNSNVDYLVVAGGASGGSSFSSAQGGGGAGGFRLSNSTCMPAPLTSPLASPTGLPVTATGYPITVGAGGASAASPSPTTGERGNPGSNSVFSTITSAGGGGGGTRNAPAPNQPGIDGGSGGGGSGNQPGCGTAFPGGAGNTPPVSPSQGNPGGTGQHVSGSWEAGGGGGGAGAAGGNAVQGSNAGDGGCGGIGSYVVSAGFAGCNGTPGPVGSTRYFAGGAGGVPNNPGNPGGVGGAGGGATSAPSTTNNGTTNTGGGGSTGADGVNSGAGGSGIVIIRYKYQ